MVHQFIPKWVRPPTGGWYHTPKNHTVNAAIAFSAYGVIMYYLYLKGEENTYDPQKVYSMEHVKRWENAVAKQVK
ncbi:putative membrane protein [Ogataea parapolymorpha DL-1]|uniref:Membrane protein n=1 Tax=Ogataea parapolymorpha (strain ATCC 26012 / BCRC 20466 / JCM 22074 / NRRL Y-7560 / DL-1) TaxID=871575 RepID=W1QL67_OGAPD|nr:putative membrane protein [Ogataea parapolymorpha DL-1]ESX01941.1 putative membrane protein [Ogataea parapolymorpha DL-1]